MNRLKALAFAFAIAATGSQVAHAQFQFRDAGAKMRGEFFAGHEAAQHQHSARSHARSLYYYTQVQPAAPSTVVSPAVAQEHVQSIQSDVDKSLRALRVIKSKYAEDKHVQSEIVKIETILANVKVHCGTCAEECVKADLACAKLMHCCVEMFHDLDEAHMKTSALLKHLKLDALPEMPPKAAIDGKKKTN